MPVCAATYNVLAAGRASRALPRKPRLRPPRPGAAQAASGCIKASEPSPEPIARSNPRRHRAICTPESYPPAKVSTRAARSDLCF